MQAAFKEADSFESRGGMKAMGDAMGRGMVLVLSLWDDHSARMLWLDSQVVSTNLWIWPNQHWQ